MVLMAIFFGYSPNISVVDSNITDNFSHGDPRILSKSFSKRFSVVLVSDDAFSAISLMEATMVQLLV